jgi:L-rhamnose mutarotase
MFKERTRSGPKGHLEGFPLDKNNLVYLTPREHFIAHILLHKIYYGKRYGVQCGTALFMFFKHKQKSREIINNSKQYQKYKEIGISALSEAQKGKIPARDQETGELIGHVDINHPNILSGKWAHHHKGRKRSKEFCQKMKKAHAGSGNSNYKNIPENEIWEHLDNYIKNNLVYNYIIYTDWALKCVKHFKSKYSFKSLTYIAISNKLGKLSKEEIIKKYNKKYDSCVIYDKWAKRKLKKIKEENDNN